MKDEARNTPALKQLAILIPRGLLSQNLAQIAWVLLDLCFKNKAKDSDIVFSGLILSTTVNISGIHTCDIVLWQKNA